MKLILAGMYFILFSTFLISCTPAKVDFSESQLNNLKYSFSSSDPINNALTLYTNQSSTLNFKTSDKTLDSLTVKLQYEILSAEKFDVTQVFSNYTDSISIPAGANSFSLTFQTKNSMPFSGGSADLKISISSVDNNTNFTPGEIKLKLINQSSIIPTITFNTLPYINSLNQAVYVFSGTCSDTESFLLKIDSLDYNITCTAGTWSKIANLVSLADNTYQVYAKNLTATTTYQSSSVLKDTTPPVISAINDSIYHGSTSTSPIISWSNSDFGSGIQKVEIALGSTSSVQDKFPWTDIGAVSSYQMTGLSLTNTFTYYVQLRTTDNAGNISSSFVGDGFTVNTSLPTAILSPLPSANSNVSSSFVTVSGASVVEYSYKYGLAGSTDCTIAAGYSSFFPIANTIPVTTVTENTYKICVVAKNALGNTQPYSSATQYTWTYDTTAPILSISTPVPSAYVNEVNKISFTVITSCSENGQTVNFYAESTVTATFTANNTSTCSLNSATATLNLSTFPDGGLKIKTYQYDAATNIGYSSYVNLTKDVSIPILTGSISMVSDFNSSTTTPTFSWTNASDIGSGVAEYKVAIGTSSYSSNVHAWSTVGMFTSTSISGLILTNGQTYYASVKAIDLAGNESLILTHSWLVDTTQPNVTITAPINAAYITPANQTNLIVQASCEIGLNISITVTSQVTGTFTQTHTNSCSTGSYVDNFDVSTYPEGSIQITAIQTDNAGNTRSVSILNTKDTVTPLFTNSLVSDGVYFNTLNQSPTISWFPASDTNGISKYQIAVGSFAGGSDKFSWTDIGNVTTYQFTSGLSLSDGSTYYPSIRAVDLAGNISTTITGNGWTVDATPPTAPSSLTDGNQWADPSTSPPINWITSTDLNSGISQYQIRILDSLNVPLTSWLPIGNTTSYSFTGLSLSPGNVYHTELKALDIAGNESTIAISDGWSQVVLGWKPESFIKASNADVSDLFGASVAIDGDTLVVGASGESSNQTTITNGSTASSDNSLSTSGAAYVYKRHWNPALWKYEWEQEAYIKASNADNSDNFGASVAIHQDTIAVGANFESSNQTVITNGNTAASADNTVMSSGAVYVYKRTGVNWNQEAYIKASNANAGDFFGANIAISYDTIAVGAYGEASSQTSITNGTTASSSNAASSSGAVYVYFRTGTTWAQQAYIKASNANSGDVFGTSLALDNNLLVVGAKGESSNQTFITNGNTAASLDNSANSSGAAYIYRRVSTSWAQDAYLKASNTDANDFFGSSVAISGNTVVVGAKNEASNQTYITNGTSSSSDNSLSYSGAVYVYLYSGGGWAQEAYIKPSVSNIALYFGSSVDIKGDILAVGAAGERSNQNYITNGSSASTDTSLVTAGAVFVFKRNMGIWTQVAYVKPPNPNSSDYFGNHLCLSGNTLTVSSTGEDSSQKTIQNMTSGFTYDESSASSGAVYVFKFD